MPQKLISGNFATKSYGDGGGGGGTVENKVHFYAIPNKYAFFHYHCLNKSSLPLFDKCKQ